MATSVWWPKEPNFYPMGNTPPVCLVEGLSPEQDADILMLGCGDPRNLLYTLHSSGAGKPSSTRKFDFTCCDMEPAVLARNILLISLLLRFDYPTIRPAAWNIFYHIFLDDVASSLLISECRTLLDATKDNETWKNHSLSTFLKIGSQSTLADLRDCWQWYVGTDSLPESEKAALKKRVRHVMNGVAKEKEGAVTGAGCRAAGPLYLHANLMTNEAYHLYWETGVTFTDEQDIAAAINVNPTFSYSFRHENFGLNHDLFPLPGFHLAGAYIPLEGSEQKGNLEPSVRELYDHARTQFFDWCETLRVCLRTPNKVIIRMVASDMFSLCATLEEKAKTGKPTAYCRTSPWRATILALDGDAYDRNSSPSAPLAFDVIETSNLIDHVGLLNVVIATSPLLKRNSSSTLYTESLVPHGHDDSTRETTKFLYTELSPISVLLDLTPTTYLSRFNAASNFHELMQWHFFNRDWQFHERLSWKIPSQLEKPGQERIIVMDHKKLAVLLHKMYNRMFISENVSELEAFGRTRPSHAFLRERSKAYCSRRSFVKLTHLLKSRIATHWMGVQCELSALMENDEYLERGDEWWQDLFVHNFLLGMNDAPTYEPGHPHSANKSIGPFKNWSHVPDFACVALVIPWSTVQDLDKDPATNPILMAQIRSGHPTSSFRQSFGAFEIAFGTLEVQGENEKAIGVVKEDPKGKKGGSPAIISFVAPAWLLNREPVGAIVRLCAMPTLANLLDGGPTVKGDSIYERPLTNSPNVFVFSQRLTTDPKVPVPIVAEPQFEHELGTSTVVLAESCEEVETVTIRCLIDDPQGQVLIQSRGNEIKFEQVGPCHLDIRIGPEWLRCVKFPTVVDASNTKLRIARKSKYIEVVAAPSYFGKTDCVSASRFPVVPTEKGPTTWNLPRIFLDTLPQLSVGNPNQIPWLRVLLGFVYSERERQMLLDGKTLEPLTAVNNSIEEIFSVFAGLGGRTRKSMFTLRGGPGKPIELLLFVTGIRMDLPRASVVVDAFTFNIPKAILGMIDNVQEMKDMKHAVHDITVSQDAIAIWRYMLPAFVERCRDWTHKPDCTYVNGELPLTHGPLPICECGRGKVTDAFVQHKEWSAFHDRSSRVAISPLFPVTYLDQPRQDFRRHLADHGVPKDILDKLRRGERVGKETHVVRCDFCLKPLDPGKRLLCSRCKKNVYCGKQCQGVDWLQHKLLCKKA